MATVENDVQAEARRQLARVLASVSPQELGEDMADELMSSIPELQGSTDEDFRAALASSCTANLQLIWDELGSATPTDPSAPPPGAIAWAHDLAHRGLPLAALLRAYRLGHGIATAKVLEAASALEIDLEIRWHALELASRYFFAYIDAICTYLVLDYEQERARWIRGAAAARAELVAAIIDRQPVDPRTATETLRYDVLREHLAFIVWSDPREGAAAKTGSLEEAATELAASLGGGPVLLIPIGVRVVWGWTSGAGPAATTKQSALPEGIRAAVGTTGSGLAGMAASHDQARAARRVAEVVGARQRSVVRYGPVALTALLTIDPAEAVRFAEAQLGELAADDDNMARLRATLRVYLDEHLSPARAARRLGIHQNTVVYRVKRVEEILGRTLDNGRLEVEVALRLSEGLDGLRSAGDRRKAP